MREPHDDLLQSGEDSLPESPRGVFIEIVLPFLILGLGAFLRLYRLDFHSIWADEGFTIFVGRFDIPSLLHFLAHHDAHPPLFYLVTHFMLKLSEGEFMLRLPSALSGILILLVTYLFTLRTWGRRTALVTLFSLSISASQVYCMQEIRMYPLFSLLALSATYLLYLSISEKNKWHLPLYFTAITLLLYTHYLAVFVIAAHASSLLLLTRKKKDLITVYALMVLAIIFFLPGLSILASQMKAGTTSALPFYARGLAQTFIATFAGYTFPLVPWGVEELIILALSLFVPLLGIVLLLKRKEADTLFFFLLYNLCFPVAALALLSVLSIKHVFSVKYFTYVAPLYFMITAHVLCTLSEDRRDLFKVLFIAAFSIINIMALYHWYFNPLFEKQPWKEALRYVHQTQQQGDAILIQDFFQVHCLQYYLKENRNFFMVRPVEMPEPLVKLKRSHHRIWYIAAGGWRLKDPDMKVLAWLGAHCTTVEVKEYNNYDPYSKVIIGLFECRKEEK